MIARENRLCLIVLATALLTGCASVRPPVPPSLDIPQLVQDLRAARKADKVTLAWTVPVHTTDNINIRHLGVTRICRRQDATVIDCKSPVRELTMAQLNLVTLQPQRDEKHPAERQASAVDAITASDSQNDPTGFFSYAVETLNRRGRSAGLSNQVRISLAPTLAAPSDLKADVGPQGVTLTWPPVEPPTAVPGITHVYRIYRRDAASKVDAVAGEVPVEGTTDGKFVDGGFQWGSTYLYRITVVTKVASQQLGSAQVEGVDSPSVEVKPVDVYPPAVPTGLQAVYSGAGQRPFIDLTWNANSDPDLAGYNVYRREDGTQPVKLNSELLKSPAYRDATVAPGKRYFYSVTAVDSRGNESARSQETSESTPP